MHKLIKKILGIQDQRQLGSAAVVSNSMLLQRAFGINEKQLEELARIDEPINCGRYDVIVSHRCFDEWMIVMEIVPVGTDPFNCGECPWPVKAEGTCTINIAPEKVMNEVIAYIKENA